MQTSINDELQRRFEGAKHAADIHLYLKELFGEQTRPLRHATVKELITLRMRDGASVHEHGVRMIGLVEKLVGMDLVLSAELTTDVLLLSLPSSFDSFVVNFNMNKMEPTLEELVMERSKRLREGETFLRMGNGAIVAAKAMEDGHVERAKGQLNLIHTYVCGPLSITTKRVHSYFITFTDDFSRNVAVN
ncbi:uncharacterized protein [Henckelia pumila]|uniref:uncharacterized protein n=1 Tax=Henckelia pumila TaxID=405737 RepID=UPI003C6DE369